MVTFMLSIITGLLWSQYTVKLSFIPVVVRYRITKKIWNEGISKDIDLLLVLYGAVASPPQTLNPILPDSHVRFVHSTQSGTAKALRISFFLPVSLNSLLPPRIFLAWSHGAVKTYQWGGLGLPKSRHDLFIKIHLSSYSNRTTISERGTTVWSASFQIHSWNSILLVSQ